MLLDVPMEADVNIMHPYIPSVAAEGICVLGGWRENIYAMLCRVLRKRSRCTLDNVQHALVTFLKARRRDTILV